MGGTSFLINVEHPEIRVAEVREGRLHDLDIERDGRLLGDIYKGKIANILPGMDAAFVDVGLNRNALMYVGDAEENLRNAARNVARSGAAAQSGSNAKNVSRPIGEVFSSGEDVIVQIVRPPVGAKGARVAQRLSLPGRYMVLISGSDSIGVSRRIEGHEERERLRRVAEKIRPLDHGIVVRTEAEGVAEGELKRDADFLWQHMQQIKARAQQVQAPFLLHREIGLLGRLARDRIGAHVDTVLVDAEEEFTALRDLMMIVAPQFASRIALYKEATPLFERYGITGDIARANERMVALPHGGSLAVDEAEALTAIDVNTGRFVGKSRLADTVLQTNLEAVEEATRQLRLRNIGGVIVIDFIDMERSRDRIRVMNALEAALKSDRTRTRIVQLSPLGLVEMTRRREGDSLRQLLNQPCPYCDGDGVVESPVTVATSARRQLREAARATAKIVRSNETSVEAPSRTSLHGALQVTMNPETAAAFVGLEGEHEAFEAALGQAVFVRAAPESHIETVRIETGSANEFDALRTTLQPGARFQVAQNTLMKSEFLGDFTIVAGCVVHLPPTSGGEGQGAGSSRSSKPENQHSNGVAVLEVSSIGRWFCTARIIARSQSNGG